jgi:3-hydroxyisobutyrate dehydrogenase-like beta-hydroxyacid dehydrogenase
MKVGFIGLGDMGGAMARRIIDAGFPTVLWARRPEVLAAYDAANVETAASPAELAARVDVVCICVWADHDVRDVLERDDGVLAGCGPGTVVAVHSTTEPATCRALARVAAERGVVLLDVPVSGGRDVALAGNLTVAVGGDEDAAARCRPVFESFGDPVLHVGPVGTAQLVKLVNNTLFTANLAMADDALALGDAVGVRRDALVEMLRHGSGRSYALDIAVAARASAAIREAARPALEKDVSSLTVDAASRGGTEGELLVQAAREALRRLADPPAGWATGDAASGG